MITVLNKDRPSLSCDAGPNLIGNSFDLLVTGTYDDPFYVHSPGTISLGSISNINQEDVTGSGSNKSLDCGYSKNFDSTQLVSNGDIVNANINGTHLDIDPENNTNKINNDNSSTNITYNTNNAIDSINGTNSLDDEYFKHKFLLKLRKKQFNNNFDLGLYLLIKFGGPFTTMGMSILNDDELLECSQISRLKNFREVEKWYSEQYNLLLDQFYKVNGYNIVEGSQANLYKYDRVPGVNGHYNSNNGIKHYLKTGIQYLKPPDPLINRINNIHTIRQNKMASIRLNKKLSKLIPGKKWFSREKLYKKVVEQSHWNPFSIFGSSIPYVSINQVFNVESSGNYVVGRVKDGVLSRIDSTMANSSTNGLVKSDRGVDGKMSSVINHSGGENSTNTMMIKYLKKKWTKESKKTINWNRDPLLNVEVLWYINSTGRYLDKSKDVCVLQKCYCTTPDPNVRFNWNDPRNRRDSPRGSMGFLLDSRGYKRAYSRYLELDHKHNGKSVKKVKIKDDGSENNSEEEDEIKLAYYSNYFRNNTLN